MNKNEEQPTIEIETLQTQEVKIGSLSATGDYRRVYRFQGEHVGSTRNYHGARSRDDRGRDKVLYRVGEDRYIVHIVDWTRWQGEIDHSYFYDKDADITDPDDRSPSILSGQEVYDTFPDLANQAGLCFFVELDLSE